MQRCGWVGCGDARYGRAGQARSGRLVVDGAARQARLGRDGRFGSGPFRTGMVRFGRQGRVRTGTDWSVQAGQVCHGGVGSASVWQVAVRQVGQCRSRTGTDWCVQARQVWQGGSERCVAG